MQENDVVHQSIHLIENMAPERLLAHANYKEIFNKALDQTQNVLLVIIILLFIR